MRRGRAALAVVIALLIPMLLAEPASAGGPTSVLLVAPGSGQTASLYTSDTDYQTLAGLVGAFGGNGASAPAAGSGTSNEVGRSVTLTWLVHDVQVWRVDHVYFEAAGGPWIATQTTAGDSGSILDNPVVWHRATSGKELVALLNRLGVSPGGSGSVTRPGIGIAASPAAGTEEKGTAHNAASQTRGGAGWLWGLAGLILGVVLTLAGIRLHARRRAVFEGVAVAEPADAINTDMRMSPFGADSALGQVPTDELSSPARPR